MPAGSLGWSREDGHMGNVADMAGRIRGHEAKEDIPRKGTQMEAITTGIQNELEHIRQYMPEFRVAYNERNGKYRRVRNCLPRTDLMVKGLVAEAIGGKCRKKGFIPHAMIQVCSDLKEENGCYWSFSRIIDIGCQIGDWWAGQCHWEWIVEVENNWAELRGTICDLFRTQAKRKLGVFYHNEAASEAIKSEVVAAVKTVFGTFKCAGFRESKATLYEIIVLPDSLSRETPAGATGLYSQSP